MECELVMLSVETSLQQSVMLLLLAVPLCMAYCCENSRPFERSRQTPSARRYSRCMLNCYLHCCAVQQCASASTL